MEKLPMCRICLAENVLMYVVVNRKLHKLYEKLTDIPFVTEDSRPILACFFCCAKLKQCYRLLRQCLEAEELFTQRMFEDYEPNLYMNQDHVELCSGFIKSPIVHISINDECQTESVSIKEELPAVCEGQDDIIEPKEEQEIDELEPDNSCLNVADHAKSDLEDDKPLTILKTETKDGEVNIKKRRAGETTRTNVAKKSKLDIRRTKQENAITAEQTKREKSNSQVIRITRTSNCDTYFKEPYKCDQRNFNPREKIMNHTLTRIDEKHECSVRQRSFSQNGNLTKLRKQSGEKYYKCDVCQRCFSDKGSLSSHIRIHADAKPYKCNVCQRNFCTKDGLMRHIRTRTGEKPFKCDVCQRRFSDKGSLTNHVRIHTGEKPYKCDVCQRSFSVKSYIWSHIQTHTGDKPYTL